MISIYIKNILIFTRVTACIAFLLWSEMLGKHFYSFRRSIVVAISQYLVVNKGSEMGVMYLLFIMANCMSTMYIYNYLCFNIYELFL